MFTNSRDVADYFEKQHKNVIRDIDALILEDAEAKLNFEQCSIPHANGRSYRAFNMDRTGFTLLAMGFTGSSALRL